MNRRILACVLAISLGFATGALGHGDEKHVSEKAESADGHAAAIGGPGDPDQITRSIDVEMSDEMRFRPDSIRVERGETIRFAVRNVGKLKHEMVLGTIDELREHAELMRKFPEMEHEDPNQVSVEPGETGELIWHFTEGGTFDFACLVPGHYEAGMAGKILVSAESSSVTSPQTEEALPGAGAGSEEGGKGKIEGVVRKVDKSAGKVTIRHGPIENLGMPKMTMIFRVRDPAMLDRLKEGDRILFVADRIDGKFTVMQVEPAE
jgi:uncharacterized cupredoxin-like copper-binding protein